MMQLKRFLPILLSCSLLIAMTSCKGSSSTDVGSNTYGAVNTTAPSQSTDTSTATVNGEDISQYSEEVQNYLLNPPSGAEHLTVADCNGDESLYLQCIKTLLATQEKHPDKYFLVSVDTDGNIETTVIGTKGELTAISDAPFGYSMSTYTNRSLGYEIPYPSTYSVNNITSDQVIVYSDSSDENAPNITIQISCLPATDYFDKTGCVNMAQAPSLMHDQTSHWYMCDGVQFTAPTVWTGFGNFISDDNVIGTQTDLAVRYDASDCGYTSNSTIETKHIAATTYFVAIDCQPVMVEATYAPEQKDAALEVLQYMVSNLRTTDDITPSITSTDKVSLLDSGLSFSIPAGWTNDSSSYKDSISGYYDCAAYAPDSASDFFGCAVSIIKLTTGPWKEDSDVSDISSLPAIYSMLLTEPSVHEDDFYWGLSSSSDLIKTSICGYETNTWEAGLVRGPASIDATKYAPAEREYISTTYEISVSANDVYYVVFLAPSGSTAILSQLSSLFEGSVSG